MMIWYRVVCLFSLLLLVACAAPPTPQASVPVQAFFTATTAALPVTTSGTPSATPALGPPAMQATPTPQVHLCSPFPGYTQAQLMEAISNPYQPPSRPGSDDPHQAVDLAVIQNGMAIEGGVVQLVLDGSVAAVISERFPYGNALLVETPLESLPADWLEKMALPTPAPTLGPHPSLTCPQLQETPQWDSSARSLYLLYAHLAAPPDFQLGDQVECGAPVGLVGQSGNALHPHLHLEARLGPGGARFPGIAHYETRAAPEEMWGYCTWRVSGIFQLVDPTRLLSLLP